MAVTREQIEGQITAKMQQKSLTRQQAIAELLAGAKKGAGRAEKDVTLAQDALRTEKDQAKVAELKKTIEREGRNASNENQRVALLKQIIEDEKQKQ